MRRPVLRAAAVPREQERLDLRVKRVYDPASRDDGLRVLVDRLWPRGLKKEQAAVDHWVLDLAPSTELRRWFSHDPARWQEFRQRYARELQEKQELLDELRSLARQGRVTLLFAAHDEAHNNAAALRDIMLG